MQIFTTEQLGPKRSITPQNFLLCYDVPIARTGDMYYRPEEIVPAPGEPELQAKDGMIIVSRSEADVFRPETIQSFEGATVTDDHPDIGMIDSTNWSRLSVGDVRNVRRGDGALSGCLIADLMIRKQEAIDAIRDGKREVSCGYNAEYQQEVAGFARQIGIIGNHVALVEQGRCGPQCAIGDRKMAAMQIEKNVIKDRLKEIGELVETSSNPYPHITFNVNGKGITADKVSKDDDEPDDKEKKKDDDMDTKDAALKSISDGIKSIDARLGAVESFVKDAKIKFGDEWPPKKKDDDDDADKDKTKDCDDPKAKDDGEKIISSGHEKGTGDDDPDDDTVKGKGDDKKKTKDSMFIPDPRGKMRQREIWQDTLSRAEILMPGVRLPTFDAAMDAQKANDVLCSFRRRAIVAAYETERGRDAIAPFMEDTNKPGFAQMTCDAMRVLFVAASDSARGANKIQRGSHQSATAKAPTTPAELNAFYREFYAKK